MHSSLTRAPCVHPKFDRFGDDSDRRSMIAFDAMGCRFEMIIVYDRARGTGCDLFSDSGFESASRAILEEMRELVMDWHRRLSVFEDGSIVSRINRAKGGELIEIDQDLCTLLVECERYRVMTDGAFNVASGTLMRALGFRDVQRDRTCIEAVDLEHAFEVDERRGTVCKTHDLIEVDFGAVAKGYVIDLVREELMEFGVSNAFVHGGTSSVYALGRDERDQSWTMQVGGEEQDGLVVELDGMSAGISETNARVLDDEGEQRGHVMDPRQKESASSAWWQVACVHQSAAFADAISTALCVDHGLFDRIADKQIETDACVLIAFDKNNGTRVYDPIGIVGRS